MTTESYSIEIIKSDKPIKGLITKFGGQPTWLTQPEWPLGRESGKPMQFICQIELDKKLFPHAEAQMAYLFITEYDETDPETYSYDAGENAVILQPGVPLVPISSQETGPSLDVECTVKIIASKQDEPFIPEQIRMDWEKDKFIAYAHKLEGNKIGGTPYFIQGDDFPDEKNNWQLLLQLDSDTHLPFYINFGDAGVGYLFINEKATIGKFMFQSS